MSNGDDGFRIRNREIWEGLNQVRDRMWEIDRRLDRIERHIDDVLSENSKIRKEYGSRLRKLEVRFYGILAGLLAATMLMLQGSVIS